MNLEDDVFQIDIEVPQQGVRNERVVPGRKVVTLEKWRACRDSNAGPSASEADTLSS